MVYYVGGSTWANLVKCAVYVLAEKSSMFHHVSVSTLANLLSCLSVVLVYRISRCNLETTDSLLHVRSMVKCCYHDQNMMHYCQLVCCTRIKISRVTFSQMY